MWPRTPLSFQATVLWTVVPLTALTAALAAAVSYAGSQRAADRHAAAVAGQAAHRVADHVTDLLDETAAFAGWCAAVPLPEDPTAADFRPLFDNLVVAFESRPHLTVLNLTLDGTGDSAALVRTAVGTVVYQEFRGPPSARRVRTFRVSRGVIRDPPAEGPSDFDARERPYYAAAREARRPVWIDSYEFRPGGLIAPGRGVAHAVPALTAGGVERVWNVSLGAEAVAAYLGRVQADLGGGYAFVVEERYDGTRLLLAHPDRATGDPAAEPLLQPARIDEPRGRATSPELIAGPGDALTAVAALPSGDNPRWLVASVIPRDELLADARRAAARQAGLLAGLVVGVTGLAVWLARRLARPLRHLQDQATTIAAGGQAAALAETGPAEVRALAAAFNQMAAAVAAREADLVRSETAVRQLAADLERRVVDRTADLATANKELEAFAYSVSHDLRAPLRAIDGFGQALLEDYADRLDDTGRDYLARLRAGSQRMATLIDDLLMLSRVARTELAPDAIDLSALARWVVRGLQSAAPGRALAMQIEPAVRARGDPTLLQTVLENLLANAWKYTAKAADAKVEFGVTAVGGERAYFVRDNGAGFDMRYAHKLFRPFQRLHPADEFEGHGIGLATVQRIVARHGGRVWAEGTVGGGATFYFTLGPGDVENDQ